ncbi:hypothetical protein [Kitasatospora sp. NPDC050543]|uniref:hypothetical protein n=1 Tax=Kitasatospora sp. NPDC050543 TaxID=3364054 RepID=UPI0037ADC80F
MLTKSQRVAVRSVTAVLISLGLAAPAAADGGPGSDVYPCANADICVVATKPGGSSTTTPPPGGGSGGGGAGGGGTGKCFAYGAEVPCWSDDLGWYSEPCYYKAASPQPPASDPAWAGNDPAKGALYSVTCREPPAGLGIPRLEFFAQPPVGPAPVTPQTLQEQALTDMAGLVAARPVPRTAPTGQPVVGVPVWLWYETPGQATPPAPVRASVPGIVVTATAELVSADWDMGDHAPGQPHCLVPGTPYQAGRTGPSPDCGYTYTRSAAGQPEGAFYPTVTLHWKITAKVTEGPTGTPVREKTVDKTSNEFELRVAEVQVLN